MELNTVKPLKTEPVYNGKFVWSRKKEFHTNLLVKKENCPKLSIFPVCSDSVFTGFNELGLVNPVKMEPVYNRILF